MTRLDSRHPGIERRKHYGEDPYDQQFEGNVGRMPSLSCSGLFDGDAGL
jgi:hypothetical protein